MLRRGWTLLKDSVDGFVEDGAMSHGAAIAYYTIFSVAPLLLIATAIAGLAFGQEAAEGAVADRLQELLGRQGAEAVQAMLRGASNRASGTVATLIGVITLMLTASGAFGELQTALNAIWKAPAASGGTLARLLRAKLASLALVVGTGLLLLVSLTASAVLTALVTWVGRLMPGIAALLGAANFVLSFLMLALLFAVIYKVLPDRDLHWRDVAVGAVVTALLFTLGKTLIGWYIGGTGIASTYGAASALLVVLLWVYYSAQIFLLGAEFTKAWAGLKGSPEALAAGARPPEADSSPRRRRKPRQRDTEPTLPAAATPVRSLLMRSAALVTVLLAAIRRR